MLVKRNLFFLSAIAIMFFLAGCGGGGGGTNYSSQSGIEIGGTAQAPQGAGLRTKGRAANTLQGLQNVADGTVVYAYNINNNGDLTGSALASTATSGGSFTLKLPKSITTITTNIVVVVGAGSNRMRAFVTAITGLKINPVSEYVVSEVVAGDEALSDFSVSELASIAIDTENAANLQSFNLSSYGSVSAAVTALNSNAQIAAALNDSISLAIGSHTAKAICGASAIANVDTARGHIFKASITESDFNKARDAVDAALAASPDCPDANLLGAIVDLIEEADRIGSDVLTDPYNVFPIEIEYDVSGNTLDRSVRQLTNPVLSGLPRVADSGTIDEHSQASEYQQEIISNTMPVLIGALAKLGKVRTAVASQPDWAFSYPKDPANVELGYDSLDKNDVDLLTGALQLSIGFVYYLLAFNLDTPANYATTDPCPGGAESEYKDLVEFNLCSAADANGNNTFTPEEYLVPRPFGTLKPDGASHMANAETNIVAGLNLLNTAVDNILEETSATVGGMHMTSALLADVEHYQHYLSEITASFGGTTTNITVPASVDCWRGGGSYYHADSVFDPAYNSNQITNCLLQVTTEQEKTAAIKLSAIFDITDFRNVMPDYVLDEKVQRGDRYQISSNYIGNTIGGIFPNGVQSSWFEHEYFDHNFNLGNLTNSITGTIIPNLPQTGVTLTIDGAILTPTSVTSSGTSNKIIFRIENTMLPSTGDYFTINYVFGTDAVLSVPGYQPKTFTVYGRNHDAIGFTLTPL